MPRNKVVDKSGQPRLVCYSVKAGSVSGTFASGGAEAHDHVVVTVRLGAISEFNLHIVARERAGPEGVFSLSSRDNAFRNLCLVGLVVVPCAFGLREPVSAGVVHLVIEGKDGLTADVVGSSGPVVDLVNDTSQSVRGVLVESSAVLYAFVKSNGISVFKVQLDTIIEETVEEFDGFLLFGYGHSSVRGDHRVFGQSSDLSEDRLSVFRVDLHQAVLGSECSDIIQFLGIVSGSGFLFGCLIKD